MSGSLSSSEILSVLRRAGFTEISQRGSHLKLRKQNSQGQVFTVILKHPAKDVPQGTFASILRQAGMSKADFDAFRQ